MGWTAGFSGLSIRNDDRTGSRNCGEGDTKPFTEQALGFAQGCPPTAQTAAGARPTPPRPTQRTGPAVRPQPRPRTCVQPSPCPPGRIPASNLAQPVPPFSRRMRESQFCGLKWKPRPLGRKRKWRHTPAGVSSGCFLWTAFSAWGW